MNVGKINNTLEFCGLQKDTCIGKFGRVLDEKNHERMPRYGGKVHTRRHYNGKEPSSTGCARKARVATQTTTIIPVVIKCGCSNIHGKTATTTIEWWMKNLSSTLLTRPKSPAGTWAQLCCSFQVPPMGITSLW